MAKICTKKILISATLNLYNPREKPVTSRSSYRWEPIDIFAKSNTAGQLPALSKVI